MVLEQNLNNPTSTRLYTSPRPTAAHCLSFCVLYNCCGSARHTYPFPPFQHLQIAETADVAYGLKIVSVYLLFMLAKCYYFLQKGLININFLK